jgi:hypothetical protein
VVPDSFPTQPLRARPAANTTVNRTRVEVIA